MMNVTRRGPAALVMALTMSVLYVVGPSAVAASTTSLPFARRLTGYLVTPDGAKLRYSVMLPADGGRFPVALLYNGYDAGSIGGPAWQQGKTWMSSELETDMLRHGYAVMGLQIRGTGCSTGTFDLFSKQWGTDGAQGVRWAARQPWSTGRVGMFEWSWPGISQLFTAAQRPKGLAAIAPGMVVTDPLRDVGAPGGLPNLTFPTLWWATIQAAWTDAGQGAAAEHDATCLSNIAVNVTNGQLHSPTSLSTHLYEDSFWAQHDLLPMTRRINVPVLSMVDWQDEEVGSRGGYYQNGLNPKTTWLVGTNGQHDIYLFKAFRKTLLAFLDHYVKGRTNGFTRTPHLQLWQDATSPGGAQSSMADLTDAKPSYVVSQSNLPLSVRANRLFFTSSGRLSVAKPRTGGVRSFLPLPGPVVNFGIPSAITGTDGGPIGEAPWQQSSPAQGALAYTSGPLAHSAVVAGPASVDVWVSTALPVGALQATITDVRPDGQEIYLQRGWLDLTQRALMRSSTTLLPIHPQTLAAVSAMPAGKATLVRIELPNFSHVFRQGSSIRIILDGPSPTGDWLLGSVATGLDRVWSTSVRPSSLVLGVMRTSIRTRPLVSCTIMPGTPCRENTLPIPHTRRLRLRAP